MLIHETKTPPLGWNSYDCYAESINEEQAKVVRRIYDEYLAGQTPYTIAPGERIAQLVVLPVAMLTPVEVDALDETARGEGGFGSTGKE